jgi:TonB family protein
VLKTLDNYIEIDDRPSFLTGRDPRFSRILAASILCHVVFLSVIIRLNIWSRWEVEQPQSRGSKLVLLAEIGPPAERKPLRALVESKKEVDLNRLQYDPDKADDVNLTARSPRLGNPSGAPNSGQQKTPQAKPPDQSASPGSGDNPKRIAPPVASAIAQAPIAQTSPAPAGPNPTAPVNSPPAPPPPRPEPAERQGSQGTRELSLQAVEGQYMAHVRSKIYRWNQKIMPRDWIRDVLTKQVSADFNIMIARGGRLVKADLVRSSGYSTLDDTARQAIYNAKPFDGYPPNAGDTITLTVTVYFTPLW